MFCNDLLCDILYSETPAIDDCSFAAALYSSKTSHVLDAYGLITDKQNVNMIEDITHEH